MSDRTISIDDLITEIDEHLSEVDATYLASLAEKVIGGEFDALSDGVTIRHRTHKRNYKMVIDDILTQLHSMEPEHVADLASSILTDTYKIRDDGKIDVTFKEENVPSPRSL
jgi:hypothetical protein